LRTQSGCGSRAQNLNGVNFIKISGACLRRNSDVRQAGSRQDARADLLINAAGSQVPPKKRGTGSGNEQIQESRRRALVGNCNRTHKVDGKPGGWSVSESA